MNKIIAISVLTLTLASAVYAADDKSPDKQASTMQGDMMKYCQSHMKDGKMMDSTPKDMMAQCQEMMKNGGMTKGGMMQQDGMMHSKPSGAVKSDAPKAAEDAE